MSASYMFRKKQHFLKTYKEVRQRISLGSLLPRFFFLRVTEFEETILGSSPQKMNPQFKSQGLLWKMQSLV